MDAIYSIIYILLELMLDDNASCQSAAVLLSTNKSSTCDRRHFGCHNGLCISTFLQCDGRDDCGDFSDELFCDIKRMSVRGNMRCNSWEFMCHDQKSCVPHRWVCDGFDDCKDGSDELSNCHPDNCTGYACNSEQCIPTRWRCDGNSDCKDKSDEIGCSVNIDDHCKISEGRYMCSDGLCLPPSSVCNNVSDCFNGEDEGKLCEYGGGPYSCRTRRCNQKCMMTPQGPKCYCTVGYELQSDQSECLDVNECDKLEGICSQRCENTVGSYFCSCQDGYQLLSDRTSCRVKGDDPQLLMSDFRGIRMLNLRSHRSTSVHQSEGYVNALTYDGRNDNFLWSEGNYYRFEIKQKMNGNGHSETTLLRKGLLSVDDIEIDWLNRKLYIADSTLKKIFVCDMDGSSCVVIVDGVRSSSISLDPSQGLMFWTVHGETPSIAAGGMDGSGISAIVDTTLLMPQNLHYDRSSSKLFWTDVKLKRIECCDRHGNGRKLLVDGDGLYHPYGIEIFESSLFWTDLEQKVVMSCNKFTGRDIGTVFKESTQPLHLLVVHPVLYEDGGSNPCRGTKCSHVCLLTVDGGFACRCPNGMSLGDDNSTCNLRRDRDYLLIASESRIVKLIPEEIGKDVVVEESFPIFDRSVGALVYDQRTDLFYLSDLDEDVILSTHHYRNDETNVFVDMHIDTVKGLALDTIGDNLYWTDAGLGTVQVANLNGSSRQIIYNGLVHPTDITLDLDNGLGFILEGNMRPRILQICLAGETKPKTLINVEMVKPQSLFIDRTSNNLFWVDLELRTVESVNTLLMQRSVIAHHDRKPLALGIVNHTVYWIDDAGTINAVSTYLNLDVDSYSVMPSPRETIPMMLTVTNSLPYSNGRSCIRDGIRACPHLCLQDESGRKCGCPLGFDLAPDGLNCQEKVCSVYEFMCSASKACIPKRWMCDGIEDCNKLSAGDISDEQHCTDCLEDEFKCRASGKCIHQVWRCDGTPDCNDRSDEDEEMCKRTEADVCKEKFACGQGQCIDRRWVCDSEKDCSNGKDEIGCDTNRCSNRTEFRCTSGQCIPLDWLCDGTHDCKDGIDESICVKSTPVACTESDYTCADGKCVDSVLKCDGDFDCIDGSDEDPVLCGYKNDCNKEQWECTHSGQCLPHQYRCDGKAQCPNGEDEENCTEVPLSDDHRQKLFQCSTSEFVCDLNQCIPQPWLCDGVYDCTDKSDEVGCPTSSSSVAPTTIVVPSTNPCPSGQFQCVSGECLDDGKLCDGHPDCDDFSDESAECMMCSKLIGGCSHVCTNTPHGAKCSCPVGLRLYDGRVCEDVDECEEWGRCSQLCVNTKGSYKCSCREPEYMLEPDMHSCRSDVDDKPDLLMSVDDQIRSVSGDGFHVDVLVDESDEEMKIVDVAYDHREKTVYYINNKNNLIKALKNDPFVSWTIVETPSPPTSVDIDYVTRHIYYSDEKKRIRACTTDGYSCTTLIINTLDPVVSLVTVPSEGTMFWLTWAITHDQFGATLWRSQLDGSEEEVLVQNKLVRPRSLTADLTIRRLFWADLVLNIVESVNFDGRDRKRILKQVDLGNPIGITIFQDDIYWVSRRNGLLMRANKFQENETTVVRHVNRKSITLRASHPALQPSGENPCLWNSAECSHMCVLGGSTYSCVCPDGFVRLTDLKCINPLLNQKKDETSVQEISSCQEKCQNGGTCEQHQTNIICRCPKGVIGQFCDVIQKDLKSGSENDYSMSIGCGIGVTLSFVLLAALCFVYRKRIRDKIERTRGKGISILFTNNNNDDDDRIKLNNERTKTKTSRLSKSMSTKRLLSFINPLNNDNVSDEVVLDADSWHPKDSETDSYTNILQTTDTENEENNSKGGQVQFHIWPSCESLTN